VKASTHKVERGSFKVEVSLKGVIEAEQMLEVSVKPEGWTMPMLVKRAVEHGTPVKKGDVLVELDLDKIDLALRDMRAERELAELAIRQAQEELPVLEKNLPLDLASAERANAHAQEDLKRYLEIDRPLQVESAGLMLKNANYYLESAKEELKQLQKMYRDKDLTEETEEFILKRQRHAVEMAEFHLKGARIQNEEMLKIRMPRMDVATRESVTRAALAWDKAKNQLPLALNQKRLALAKLKFEQQKATEKLRNLEKDREAFTVRAPADGLVYHGKCLRGQWTTAAAVSARLQRGGMINAEEVIMTIVAPRPVFVRATVEEKDLHLLKVNLKGRAIPAGYPDVKLPCCIAGILPVPITQGNFDARVVLEVNPAPLLGPGMTCNVKFVPYRKTDALTVPASAVFEDDSAEEAHYVYLHVPGAKPLKRLVKVGKTAGDRTEILDGLREGDMIRTSKPDQQALTGAVSKPVEKKP
jgi:multidrug efflux pump subunit AcrA (membrane-fusion protein)